ncbi:hypothetical protein CFP56_038483 [Quercus suber]|uniref:Uncharacterized protein n=1 Tax=Quercus suber TaxID=58331 RepID=A0AAW0J226_QUESU
MAYIKMILTFDCTLLDPRTLTYRSRSSEFFNREPMVDDRVVCFEHSRSMAAANVARINHAEPGPIDTTIQGPLPAAVVV